MTIQKKPRRCELCGKGFRPMTDAHWRNAKVLHEQTSNRHRSERHQSGVAKASFSNP